MANTHENLRVLPCTIKMISAFDIKNEETFYKSIPVSLIELLARVVSIKETSLRLELLLQDHTGFFQAISYKKQDSSKDLAFKNFTFKENCYSLIHGTIRKLQDSYTLIINSIQNINNRTYINYFNTKTIICFLKLFRPQQNKTEIVLAAFSKLPNRPKGYTLAEIQKSIGSIPASALESCLNELLLSCKITNGQDWNHFRLN